MIADEPLFSLENTDLSTLFMPSWAKEKVGSKKEPSSYPDSKPHTEHFDKKNSRNKNNRRTATRDSLSPREQRSSHSKSSSSFQKKESQLPLVRLLEGWKLVFLPEKNRVDAFAKQIRAENKAYPLFELARLILEKSDRYHVQFTPDAAAEATPLYQCTFDESLWVTEKEAIAHAFKTTRERYYGSEKITLDAPKAFCNAIAVCGMSNVLLGPTNHHEYQERVRRLHAERFSHLSLEHFKSRIQIVREEAALERWKQEQSVREEFYLLATPQGEEPKKWNHLSEVEMHFKKEIAPTLVIKLTTSVTIPGAVALHLSASEIQERLQHTLAELHRFPLSLSHQLGKELGDRSFPIFKAHENIVYVATVRPRVLNRHETPLSENLATVFAVLEAHEKSPRAEQWKALLASRPLLDGMTEEAHQSAVAKDLSWLIREGYVTNYALRGFEITRKAKEEVERL